MHARCMSYKLLIAIMMGSHYPGSYGFYYNIANYIVINWVKIKYVCVCREGVVITQTKSL